MTRTVTRADSLIHLFLLIAVLSATISIALAIVGIIHANVHSAIMFCLFAIVSTIVVFKVFLDIYKAAADADIKGISRIV